MVCVKTWILVCIKTWILVCVKDINFATVSIKNDDNKKKHTLLLADVNDYQYISFSVWDKQK